MQLDVTNFKSINSIVGLSITSGFMTMLIIDFVFKRLTRMSAIANLRYEVEEVDFDSANDQIVEI